MSGINLDYFLFHIYDFFVTLRVMIFDQSLRQGALGWLGWLWWVFLVISLILLPGIIYFIWRLEKVRQSEHERVYGAPANLIAEIKEDLAVLPSANQSNPQWEKIMKLAGSDNPNDWSSAIIEADKMLEIVANTFSAPGNSLGEKLKNIERSDFLTLDEAWQAHKARNKIAHQPNYQLNQRDARVALDNYEKVFREFDFI